MIIIITIIIITIIIIIVVVIIIIIIIIYIIIIYIIITYDIYEEKYKRVGNPIAWANPTGGGTVEDNSSKHWTWVFPAGGAFILFLCLLSRWRSQRREREEQVGIYNQYTIIYIYIRL